MCNENKECNPEEKLQIIATATYNVKLKLIDVIDKSLSKTYERLNEQDREDLKMYMLITKEALVKLDTVDPISIIKHMSFVLALHDIVLPIDPELAIATGQYIAMLSLYLSLHALLTDDELSEYLICILSSDRKALATKLFDMLLQQVKNRLGE